MGALCDGGAGKEEGGEVKETALVKDIQAELSHGNVRLFRNNTGSAWQGYQSPETVGRPGRGRSITLEHARLIHFGLSEGSSDLIGLKSVVITPEMVGKKFAVFVGLEAKTTGGRARKEQVSWHAMLTDMGAISGFARSMAAAREIIGE